MICVLFRGIILSTGTCDLFRGIILSTGTCDMCSIQMNNIVYRNMCYSEEYFLQERVICVLFRGIILSTGTCDMCSSIYVSTRYTILYIHRTLHILTPSRFLLIFCTYS